MQNVMDRTGVFFDHRAAPIVISIGEYIADTLTLEEEGQR
jgi:hypothetical protein